MVDALVSGASAERRGGSTPLLGTRAQDYLGLDALLWSIGLDFDLEEAI